MNSSAVERTRRALLGPTRPMRDPGWAAGPPRGGRSGRTRDWHGTGHRRVRRCRCRSPERGVNRLFAAFCRSATPAGRGGTASNEASTAGRERGNATEVCRPDGRSHSSRGTAADGQDRGAVTEAHTVPTRCRRTADCGFTRTPTPGGPVRTPARDAPRQPSATGWLTTARERSWCPLSK